MPQREKLKDYYEKAQELDFFMILAPLRIKPDRSLPDFKGLENKQTIEC